MKLKDRVFASTEVSTAASGCFALYVCLDLPHQVPMSSMTSADVEHVQLLHGQGCIEAGAHRQIAHELAMAAPRLWRKVATTQPPA